MNKRQEQIVDAIQNFTFCKGYPPTIRELGELVGLKSTSTVFMHLDKLRAAGIVDWINGSPRTLKVTGGINNGA